MIEHLGRFFYSPNCKHKVSVPDFDLAGRNVNPFSTHARLQRFRHPRWWTRDFGWLAFVPLQDSFEGSTFECLRYIPQSFVCIDSEWRFERDMLRKWEALENNIDCAVVALGNAKNRITATAWVLCPPRPTNKYNVAMSYPCRETAMHEVYLCREWFVLWMGLLAYLLAAVGAPESNEWSSILSEAGLPQHWIDSLRTSSVLNYSPNVERAGLFLILEDRLRDNSPSVRFFLKHHVAVWYEWDMDLYIVANMQQSPLPPTPSEETSASRRIREEKEKDWHKQECRKARLKVFEPPFPIFSPQSPSMSNEPDSPSPPSPMRVSSPEPAALTAPPISVTEHPGLALIAKRMQRYPLIPSYWEEKVIQIRESREKQPPIRKNYVFEWVRDVTGKHRRTSVVENVNRERLLKTMAPSQKYYNSFDNEWDVFGDVKASETFDWKQAIHKYIKENLSPSPAEPGATHSFPSSAPAVISAVPLTPAPDSSVEIASAGKPFFDDLCVILSERYGFVPPLGGTPSVIIKPSKFTWSNVQRSLGTFESEPENKRLADAIMHFVEALVASKEPHADVWDLNPDNRRWVMETNCNPAVMVAYKMDDAHIGLKKEIVFGENCRWIQGFNGLEDWLHSCRLLSFKPLHIAHHFLQRGIPFQTFVELSNPLNDRPSSWSLRLVPCPQSNDVEHKDGKKTIYHFTVDDYREYEHRRALILSEPYGRAALLKGGVVWRLAREVVGDGDALAGPSVAVTEDGFGTNIRSSDGSIWGDDSLSHEELEIITGRSDHSLGKSIPRTELKQYLLILLEQLPAKKCNSLGGHLIRHGRIIGLT